MKLWIARNQDGSLWLHEEKPSLVYDDELRSWYYEGGSFLDFYDESIFPEVTFENSPQEVEIKLMNEIVGIAESPLKTFPRVNEFEV